MEQKKFSDIFYCSDNCYTDQPCENIYSHFKPIQFLMGSKSFKMNPETYLMDGGELDDDLKGNCIIGIQPLPDVLASEPMILLGDVFIRHFYSVFDIDRQQVSLGVKTNKKNLVAIEEVGEPETNT